MIKYISKSKILPIFFIVVAMLCNNTHGVNEDCNKFCTSVVNYDCDCCPGPCKCYDCIIPCDRSMNFCKGTPFLQYKSQSLNKAKDFIGLDQFIHQSDMPDTFGTIHASLEFTKTFRSHHLAQYLFGDDLVNGQTLFIQGSAVENRHQKAWLADYFGLPIDFESSVNFCPAIKNTILDLCTYFGLAGINKGLYLKFKFPIVSSKWELNILECVKSFGQEPFEQQYMSIGTEDEQTPLPRTALPCNFIDALQPGVTFGDQRKSMLFGTMPCRQLKKTRFSDISATLGWDFILQEDGHFGINIHTVVPTGNRPTARYLFEPIIGNGKHWELGAGITGSWIFWRNCNNDYQYASISFDATATHMFKACQARSFDLCEKPNSRYMLLVEMFPAKDFAGLELSDSNNLSTATFSKYLYAVFTNDTRDQTWTGVTPAINYTTRLVDVQIDAQVDAAIKCSFIGQEFSLDIGYEFWMRTEEKFYPCKDYCNREPLKQYVIKGDGLLWGLDTFDSDNFYDPLAGSQSKADIHSGENMKLRATDPDGAARNKGVDNSELTWAYIQDSFFVAKTNAAGDQLYSSFQPILVNTCNLDTCRGPKTMSHKVFTHVNYTWKDQERKWTPFAGFGGEVEFATKHNRKYRAASQWGAWIKAGAAFH